MPTLIRTGPYRVYFYSAEPGEPKHVHIDRDEATAKFWLEPVAIAASIGFSRHELTRLRDLVMEHRREFTAAWEAYHGS